MDKILEQRINNGFWVVTEQHQQKSHTCEEGGARLRISFWHLLMNLKNKLLLKKLLKGANKYKIILIFRMLHFLKKY